MHSGGNARFGGEVIPSSKGEGKGWRINIPNGNKVILVRVMEAGSGNRSAEYFRVSILGRGALTIDGKISDDLGQTHIDLSDDYLSQIQAMINLYKKSGGK